MQEQQNIPTDTAGLPRNGHTQPVQLSSNGTLFWRVFVPVFGTVFMSGLLLAFLLLDDQELYLPFISVNTARGVVAFLWLGWVVLVWRTVWRLKRVDADDAYLYVTNYWTTVRYPWTDVDRMGETRPLGRRIVHFHLKAPGTFGSTLSFLPGSRFNSWKAEHEELRS